MRRTKGQEEMVGFALIIIIVSIILLVFLSFSLGNRRQQHAVESYEAENFIQASLEYTTDCYDGIEYLSIRKLVFGCYDERVCLNNKEEMCDVLNTTLREMTDKSWRVGAEMPLKGYEIGVLSENQGILLIQEGNTTRNYKGAIQSFSRRGTDYTINFNVYY